MIPPQMFQRVVSAIFVPLNQDDTLEILCFSRGKLIQRKPYLRGKIEYFFKQHLMWRPRRIFWEEQGKWKAYAPKNTIQDLLTKATIIILSDSLSEKEITGIKKYCEDFGIKTKVVVENLCPFCLIQNKVTVLSTTNIYTAYDRNICKSCAVNELEKELSAKKVNLLISPGFKKYSVALLRRLKDPHKAADFLTSGQSNLSEITMVKKIDQVPKNRLKSFYKQIDEFSLPEIIKKSLQTRNIQYFLPIQSKSLKKGLLQGKNQLIIANTSAGKTLIGEMAGISHVMKKKKMIFAVPLVALANTKYEDFKKLYGPKIKVGLRIGRSRIFNSKKERREFYRNRFSLKGSDIVVATYEGLDLLFRAGDIDFSQIGCIIIDEVQSLGDPERGPTLDCMISKVRVYAKESQILALSATIGNPKEFAKDLGLDLVMFDERPVPLEQHVLISRSQEEKMRQILRLVRRENKILSSTGYRGQTIVFTNSRRKTTEIADYLRQQGVNGAHAYHSGLSYNLRRRIENAFIENKCPAVVSTYALGAGVDFPASQVIFESLLMGNKVLEPNTFTQMLGRAGRLGKHDRGRAVLLCLGESVSSLDSRTEVEISFELLNADLSPVEPNYDENACGEQILAICSSRKIITPSLARKIYNYMMGTRNFDFMHITNILIHNKMIKIVKEGNNRLLQLTQLGRAATLSFFSPEKTLRIVSLLKKKKHFLAIALEMTPPQNIYLSRKLHAYLEKTYHMRFSTRLINSPVLDVMTASLRGKEATELSKWCLTVFSKWTQTFFNCNCHENPYCHHGAEKIGRIILDERLGGKNINQISSIMTKFELLVYPGDVFSFLNAIIHELEGIERIAKAIGLEKSVKTINLLIKKIEIPELKRNN
ncbi:MAG: DUF5814 domain-containing protein [Candidatus Hodarchaeales archaeon]